MAALNGYLKEMQAALAGLGDPTRREIVEELRSHLEDRAAGLQAEDLESEEEASMSEAIERFGEAREVGTALRDVHGRGSWGEALAGMAPFLVFGLAMALSEYVKYLVRLHPGWRYLVVYSLVACYVVLLVGLGVGWVKGFPRWSYPYGGLALVFTWWWAGVMVKPRGWWTIFCGRGAWIPLLVVAVVALLITRSFRPWRQLLYGVWHDWTRLSFGLYGCMPLAVWLAFDEVTAPYSAPYLAISALILAGGALLHVRNARPSSRALAILMGLTLAWAVTTVGTAAYWHGHQEPWMREPGHWYVQARGMIITWGVLAALTFAPALLSLLRGRGRPVQAG